MTEKRVCDVIRGLIRMKNWLAKSFLCSLDITASTVCKDKSYFYFYNLSENTLCHETLQILCWIMFLICCESVCSLQYVKDLSLVRGKESSWRLLCLLKITFRFLMHKFLSNLKSLHFIPRWGGKTSVCITVNTTVYIQLHPTEKWWSPTDHWTLTPTLQPGLLWGF